MQVKIISKSTDAKLFILCILFCVIPFNVWFLSVWGHTYKRVHNRIYTVTYHIKEVKNDVVVVEYEDGSTSEKTKSLFQSLDKSIRYRENSEADRFTMFLLTVVHILFTIGLGVIFASLINPFVYKFNQKPNSIVKGSIQ